MALPKDTWQGSNATIDNNAWHIVHAWNALLIGMERERERERD